MILTKTYRYSVDHIKNVISNNITHSNIRATEYNNRKQKAFGKLSKNRAVIYIPYSHPEYVKAPIYPCTVDIQEINASETRVVYTHSINQIRVKLSGLILFISFSTLFFVHSLSLAIVIGLLCALIVIRLLFFTALYYSTKTLTQEKLVNFSDHIDDELTP